MYVVQFLASCASLFWTPAKDASVPNLVPPDKLEQANQFSLLGTFGPAPIAGLFFGLLALVSRSLGAFSPYFSTTQVSQVNLALYFNAATFVVSAITIYMLREIPKRQVSEHISAPSVAKTIWEGWKFIGHTKVVRGIVIGLIGAFSAGGVVVGLGPSYIKNTLHGGSAGWGIVFAAVFGGVAVGMFLGLRILRGFSRRRLFGLSIVGAGVLLVLIGLIPSLVVVVLLVVLLGAFAGIAYVTGYTIVGSEVDDEHPRTDVRFPAVRHPGHPVRGGRDRAGHRRRVHRPGPRRDWVQHAAHRPGGLQRHRLQLRADPGRGGSGVARGGLLPPDGRPPRASRSATT